jgi:hypothetical protein
MGTGHGSVKLCIAAVQTARILAAVNTARISEPRCTCAMACIRARVSRMENGLLADILAGEPNREREYVSPDSTDTYDRYEACAMRTGKPLHCPRSFCSVSRLRFAAVRSGINAAPTNKLLYSRAFTGPETQDFSVLRPVTSAFRQLHSTRTARVRTWGVVYSGRPR